MIPGDEIGKRENKSIRMFPRLERDFYPTIDPRAYRALAPHLLPETSFIEPCAGAFDLAAQLIAAGHTCESATDIAPQVPYVGEADALKISAQPHAIITNPPWSRPLLHQMIEHFISIAPYTWLLLDADWFHTNQARPLLRHCTDYVAVGRLLWIPGTSTRGKDNAAWYRFEQGGNGRGIRAWPLM